MLFLFYFLLFSAAQIKINILKCVCKQHPLGIDNKSLRHSWQLFSNKRSQVQTAYMIIVSDNLETLEKGIGIFWDSGNIFLDQSHSN